ncbi:MAG: tetratricopeptide repeat protein [Anaerolineae bacterium]|nr:tetratricopeptide repeat protein [Anaerolineae bacterium]
MGLRGLFARLMGNTEAAIPQEAELRRLRAAGDEARRNQQPDRALEMYQQGLSLAQSIGFLQGQEVFLGQLGSLYTEQGRFDLAEQTLNEALAIANRIGEAVRKARALLNLGAYNLTRGDLQRAKQYLEQALELGRPTGDGVTVGLALGNLADIYLKQNNPSYALRLLKEAVVLAQITQNTEQASYIIGRMGQAHLGVGEVERGRKFLVQAIQLAQQYNKPDQELEWSIALAEQQYKDGQIAEAIRLYGRAEVLAQQVGTVLSPDIALRSLLYQGVGYHKLNEHGKALDLVQRALEQARAANNPEIEAIAQSTLGSIQHALKHNDEAIAAYQSAIGLYGGRAKNEVERANAMIALGGLYQDQGQTDKALEIFDQAIDAAGEDNLSGRAQALRRIGNALQKQGNLQAALAKWNEALALFEQAGDTTQIARLLCDTGAARRSLAGINAALPDYERATTLLSSVQDPNTRGLVLSNVAILYTDLGEVETAQSFYQEAIQLARQSANRRAESLRLGNFAWFYTVTGQPQQGIKLLEEAIAISRQLDDPLLVAVQTNNLGQAYHELKDKDYATAEGLFRQAIATAQRINDSRWLAIFQSNLGRTLLAQGRVDEALPLLEGSLAASRAQNDQETIARTLSRLADAYLKTGRLADADNAAREAETIARKWGYRKGQADALMIRAGIARAQNDSDSEQRYQRDAYRLYTILHDPLAAELALRLNIQ